VRRKSTGSEEARVPSREVSPVRRESASQSRRSTKPPPRANKAFKNPTHEQRSQEGRVRGQEKPESFREREPPSEKSPSPSPGEAPSPHREQSVQKARVQRVAVRVGKENPPPPCPPKKTTKPRTESPEGGGGNYPAPEGQKIVIASK
jgi:hypothetical protein